MTFIIVKGASPDRMSNLRFGYDCSNVLQAINSAYTRTYQAGEYPLKNRTEQEKIDKPL